VAVEVKSVRPRHFVSMLRMTIDRQLKHALQVSDIDSATKIHLVCVLRDDDGDYPISRILSYALKISEEISERLEIFFGKLNEENEFIPLDL
ncbi:hypothetical protein, partial [Methylobacter sp.]